MSGLAVAGGGWIGNHHTSLNAKRDPTSSTNPKNNCAIKQSAQSSDCADCLIVLNKYTIPGNSY